MGACRLSTSVTFAAARAPKVVTRVYEGGKLNLGEAAEMNKKEVRTMRDKLWETLKTAYNAENARTISWPDDFLARSQCLRKTLIAAKEVDKKTVIQKLIEAASIAFTGTGRCEYYQ